MKVRSIIFILAISLAAVASWAQMGRGVGRCGNYDPKTEMTTRGTIEAVTQVAGNWAWYGTHLALKTEAGTIDVHLGPEAYIANQQFSFAKGDQIEVTGSKVAIKNTDTLIAREVKKGDKTLVLRDANGMPNWAGGKCR